jgi:geranylgeranyl diphosphate synthase type I
MVSTFARIQADAISGQQLDLHASRNIERTYSLKTGSYTVRGFFVLGALMAGGSSELVAALDRFSAPVGIAFQLCDDILSAFGDPAQTGKPFGNDIRSGKRTLLVDHALEIAKGKDLAALRQAHGNSRATLKQLERAVAALERSGARNRVQNRIAELLQDALPALKPRAVSTVGRELLEAAAHALTHRTR